MRCGRDSTKAATFQLQFDCHPGQHGQHGQHGKHGQYQIYIHDTETHHTYGHYKPHLLHLGSVFSVSSKQICQINSRIWGLDLTLCKKIHLFVVYMKFIKPHFTSCLKFVQKCTEKSLLDWLGFSNRSGTLFGNLKSVVLSYWHTGRLSDMTLSDLTLCLT